MILQIVWAGLIKVDVAPHKFNAKVVMEYSKHVGKATATMSPGLRLNFSWNPAANAKVLSAISLYVSVRFVSGSIFTEISSQLLVD